MKLILSLIMILTSYITNAEDYLPSAIFQLDNQFSHHVIVVEKSTHSLYLYKNDQGMPKLVKKYRIATGLITGDKEVQGDKKTPEGIYTLQVFHSANKLIKKYGKSGLIYGAGAFTLNYPNIIDARQGKTGGGIWLHSTDDDKRVSKGLDSRGCVVAVDADLKDISKYIDLNNTSVVITQNLNYLKESTWKKNKEEILVAVNKWSTAWKEKEFNKYINQYSKAEFTHPIRGRFQAFKRYKRAVFSRKGTPTIDLTNISILNFDNYAVVTMKQDYTSSVIQDSGKKVLYLKRDKYYNWKIVSEQWSKMPKNESLAFTPAMRFFTDTDNQPN